MTAAMTHDESGRGRPRRSAPGGARCLSRRSARRPSARLAVARPSKPGREVRNQEGSRAAPRGTPQGEESRSLVQRSAGPARPRFFLRAGRRGRLSGGARSRPGNWPGAPASRALSRRTAARTGGRPRPKPRRGAAGSQRPGCFGRGTAGSGRGRARASGADVLRRARRAAQSHGARERGSGLAEGGRVRRVGPCRAGRQVGVRERQTARPDQTSGAARS